MATRTCVMSLQGEGQHSIGASKALNQGTRGREHSVEKRYINQVH